jgi:hypothetical protein
MSSVYIIRKYHRQPNIMVACLRAGEALYSCIISQYKIIIQGNNTTIQCLARAQVGNHNIGLPMEIHVSFVCQVDIIINGCF